MNLVFWAAMVAFLADQASKYIVIHSMELWRVLSIDVLPPLLNLRYGENHGINFGIGGDAVNAWVWIGLALLVCGWVLWWVRRTRMSRLGLVCAGLLVGGAMGNVIDRVLYGYVLDFLNMSCCGIRNPYSFNVADIFIFAGAIGLVIVTPDGRAVRKH
ncbi:signal peptidase II [Aliishimia ponticola]|uniref:Lipoprotein signal peptidase n=1 Tax=Aliishimia ponticola TaxID=2499833 RepID=A0A4S4NKT5_9RHOB|nr:signal peptidase II [Aliishimia ponticola]THH36750.1 signal peptidase II [Aliishimia ponticola]